MNSPTPLEIYVSVMHLISKLRKVDKMCSNCEPIQYSDANTQCNSESSNSDTDLNIKMYKNIIKLKKRLISEVKNLTNMINSNTIWITFKNGCDKDNKLFNRIKSICMKIGKMSLFDKISYELQAPEDESS